VAPAEPADYAAIADLTVGAYLAEDLVSERYATQLADVAGRAHRSELLVVRDADGRVVGSVALVLDGDFGEILESDDEAAFRMLAVDPAARGRGIGELLVLACLERARAAGKRRMVLSTDPRMTAAHRLYERLGFARLPERDWSPVPGVDLLAYALELQP
jgi:ribosomal protein S18 acetylase RimI-like enzyme